MLSVERVVQLLMACEVEVMPRWWFGYLGIVVSACLSIGVMYAHKLFKYIERLNRQRQTMNRRILTAVLRTEEKARSRFSKQKTVSPQTPFKNKTFTTYPSPASFSYFQTVIHLPN